MGNINGSGIAKHLKSPSRQFNHPPRVFTDPRRNPDLTVEILQHRYVPATLATCWELIFATFSSTITTAYTLHHEKRLVSSTADQSNALQTQVLAFDPGHFSFILDPPPALMLFCCLLLGCSISSFCYRRQDADRFQTPIFVLALTGATVFGLWIGVAPNLIMLGLIPWACCVAMLFSASVHSLVRRCSRRTRVPLRHFDENEKVVILQH